MSFSETRMRRLRRTESLRALVRVSLAALAGWGLLERTRSGRIVAIVAACLSQLKFPFGTAMGIWTLIVLLGYRNSTLYEQLT